MSDIAAQIIEETVRRCQALHEYAGRSAWEHVIRDVIQKHLVAMLAMERQHLTNCCNCGRIIDKREESEGGDKFGAELSDGRWTCSFECWEATLNPTALEEKAQAFDRLDAALCNFINAAGDDPGIPSDWTEETDANFLELSKAYNGAHEAGCFPAAAYMHWARKMMEEVEKE